MQVVNPSQVTGKKVLLRLDLDVPIENGIVKEDFRLRAGLSTLQMCLENAAEVIAMGHIGRPGGKVVPELSVAPIRDWLEHQGLSSHLTSGKLKILENLRFDPREEACDPGYAEELASMGDIFVNEAFAAHHPAASTVILPTLLPHCIGLRFTKEVEILTNARNNPKKPFVVIIGGVKIEDKLPVIQFLEKAADSVLVGGKIAAAGDLNEKGIDIKDETVKKWGEIIKTAKMIVWNGPVGKFEDPQNNATEKIARMVLKSGADVIIGGGDTIAALGQYGLLKEAEEKAFVSTGGGVMLKFLVSESLPTIEALK